MSDELLIRIQLLEASNRRWRMTSLAALLAVVLLLGWTAAVLSQRQPAPPAIQPGQFKVDSSAVGTVYANFFRVTGTPEELSLECGLNMNVDPNPQAAEPIKTTTQLVMNYYTVKRLLGALQSALQEHEQHYGLVEIDAAKRVIKR